MIKIDFHGSTHGHFLEYVANVYIMQTEPSKVSIFKPPTYSAHASDSNYLNHRIIECGHFSNPIYKMPINKEDILIRIKIDSYEDNMFFIALSNLMYKAGDVGIENQMLAIPLAIRDDPAAIRNNWYSKFNERETYANHYNEFAVVNNPVFEFPFSAFFSFRDFCTELSKLSMFLGQVFCPNQSLYDLWVKFIQVNQGWQSYTKCNHILENMLSNGNVNIECSVIEQGWLNYNLSKICRLYSGSIFDYKIYPDNTQLVYQLIQEHNNTLRY